MAMICVSFAGSPVGTGSGSMEASARSLACMLSGSCTVTPPSVRLSLMSLSPCRVLFGRVFPVQHHLQAGGIVERRAIRGGGLACRMSVRDEAVQRQAAGGDQITDGKHVVRAPFRGDAQPRLAHEGRRKRERDRFVIEAGQYDLTAGREPGDQFVEQRGITADVTDDPVVAAFVR